MKNPDTSKSTNRTAFRTPYSKSSTVCWRCWRSTEVIGHAIPGIVEPTLEEYTHLGDAASKTDGRIYSPRLGALEVDGEYSGVPDDRWAFTTHTTPLNYAAISSLAAASRVLRGFDDNMATECLQTAVRVWDEEHKQISVAVQVLQHNRRRTE